MEDAFAAGYDPALELATHQTKRSAVEEETGDLEFDEEAPWTENLRRKEQDTIDRIVQGQEPGHYFVLLGPKVLLRLLPVLHLLINFGRALERVQ